AVAPDWWWGGLSIVCRGGAAEQDGGNERGELAEIHHKVAASIRGAERGISGRSTIRPTASPSDIEMALITTPRFYLRDVRRVAETIASPIPNNSMDDGSGT